MQGTVCQGQVLGLEQLIRDLERRPDEAGLRAAPEAVDLAVLKRLAEDPDVKSRARGPDRVRRLWAACGLPDFRKTGPEHHARLVARIYLHLTEGDGHIPQGWFAEQVARLDAASYRTPTYPYWHQRDFDERNPKPTRW